MLQQLKIIGLMALFLATAFFLYALFRLIEQATRPEYERWGYCNQVPTVEVTRELR